jgi:ethanolamine ammonia-lyase small subunit
MSRVPAPPGPPAFVPAAIEPEPWANLRALTPARIALGRTGASLPSREVLRFAMDHARARDAVHAPFDINELARQIATLGFVTLKVASAAPSRDVYLRRPDLGRRLSNESRAALEATCGSPVDLAIVVANGLSSKAVHAHSVPLLEAFAPWIRQAEWSMAPVVLAAEARVALGDEIGALLQARAVAVLVGERPGLSSPDSLGIYMTFAPRVGCTDAERNCISNIQPAGLSPSQAAFKLQWLLGQAFARGLSGIGLKDESDLALASRSGSIEISPGERHA